MKAGRVHSLADLPSPGAARLPTHNSVAGHRGSYFPPCVGGVDATSKDIAKPPLKGADGVVAFAKMFQGTHSETFRWERPLRLRRLLGLRDIFLMAQPPLLCKVCKEGNKPPVSGTGLMGHPKLPEGEGFMHLSPN